MANFRGEDRGGLGGPNGGINPQSWYAIAAFFLFGEFTVGLAPKAGMP